MKVKNNKAMLLTEQQFGVFTDANDFYVNISAHKPAFISFTSALQLLALRNCSPRNHTLAWHGKSDLSFNKWVYGSFIRP